MAAQCVESLKDARLNLCPGVSTVPAFKSAERDSLTPVPVGKPGWVVVELDVANAHNEISHAAEVEVLESVPQLQGCATGWGGLHSPLNCIIKLLPCYQLSLHFQMNG